MESTAEAILTNVDRRQRRRLPVGTILSAMWVTGAIAVTCHRDLIAAILVGIPIAFIALPFITLRPLHLLAIPVSLCLASVGAFYCYCWPYVICPIDLPPTARNLYATQDIVSTHAEVRFNANVDECLELAESLRRETLEAEGEIAPGMAIDRIQGVIPEGLELQDGRRWWFDIERIQRGVFYPGGGPWYPAIWVDTDRGLFYLCVL